MPDLEALRKGRPHPDGSLPRFKSTLHFYTNIVLGTHPRTESTRTEGRYQVAAECLEELLKAARDTEVDGESEVFNNCWERCKVLRIVR